MDCMGHPLESSKAHAMVPRLGKMENLICEVEAEGGKKSCICERICKVETESGRCPAQGFSTAVLSDLHWSCKQRIAVDQVYHWAISSQHRRNAGPWTPRTKAQAASQTFRWKGSRSQVQFDTENPLAVHRVGISTDTECQQRRCAKHHLDSREDAQS